MLTEEHDEFDNSVDPYDRSIDRDFDDGISNGSTLVGHSDDDELDEADEDDWDPVDWDDESIPQAEITDEYEDLED